MTGRGEMAEPAGLSGYSLRCIDHTERLLKPRERDRKTNEQHADNSAGLSLSLRAPRSRYLSRSASSSALHSERGFQGHLADCEVRG